VAAAKQLCRHFSHQPPQPHKYAHTPQHTTTQQHNNTHATYNNNTNQYTNIHSTTQTNNKTNNITQPPRRATTKSTEYATYNTYHTTYIIQHTTYNRGRNNESNTIRLSIRSCRTTHHRLHSRLICTALRLVVLLSSRSRVPSHRYMSMDTDVQTART